VLVDEHERRVSMNETLFRDVNERVRELEEGFGSPGGPLYFVCECGDAECTERMVLTKEEYESVRARGNRFVVVRGHQVPAVELVVGETDRFLVVEKHPGGPSRLAEERDPRAASR
jgi:hypothetical protein